MVPLCRWLMVPLCRWLIVPVHHWLIVPVWHWLIVPAWHWLVVLAGVVAGLSLAGGDSFERLSHWLVASSADGDRGGVWHLIGSWL